MYEIEKNVPMPQRRLRGDSEFIKSLRKMKVGDSVVSPPEYALRDQYEVYAEHKLNTDRRYTSKKLADGSRRTWRVR